MANPLPLDAAARDELARKAEAAKARADQTHAPRWYKPMELDADYPEDAVFLAACTPDVILALLAAVERGAEDTEKLRAENVNLWQIIRQKDRETYAAANSLDVAELDAMCCNLAIENAELREQVKRASHAATFMVE